VSNDYRSKNRGNAGWYYSDGKRYVPRSMMGDGSRSGYRPRRRSQQYRPAPRRSRGSAEYYRHNQKHLSGDLNRSGRVARAVFITSLSLLLLILITIIVMELINDKVLSGEDLEARYQIPVIGGIPDMLQAEKSRDKYGYKKGGYGYK